MSDIALPLSLRALATFEGFGRGERAMFALMALQADQGGVPIIRSSYDDLARGMGADREAARHAIRWLKAREIIHVDSSTRPMAIAFLDRARWLSGQIQPLKDGENSSHVAGSVRISGQIQPDTVQNQPLISGQNSTDKRTNSATYGNTNKEDNGWDITNNQPTTASMVSRTAVREDLPADVPIEIRQAIQSVPLGYDAAETHRMIGRALERIGFQVRNEYPVADRGDGHSGRIDIYAVRGTEVLALESDWQSPREKSAFKLRQVAATWRAIVTRDGTASGAFVGINAVIGLKAEKPKKKPPKPKEPTTNPEVAERGEILAFLRSLLGRGANWALDVAHLKGIGQARGKGYDRDAIEQALHQFIEGRRADGASAEMLDQPWLVPRAMQDWEALAVADRAASAAEEPSKPAKIVACTYCRERIKAPLAEIEGAFAAHVAKEHPDVPARMVG